MPLLSLVAPHLRRSSYGLLCGDPSGNSFPLCPCYRRPANWREWTIRPEQCGGRPCIRALRVRVKDVLDLLASGASHDEILVDYPYLEAEDITAALEFAAKQSDHPVIHVA